MVFIDSSHQYEHTLKELKLWFGLLSPQGLMFLHDVSDFAKTFDSTGEGGVQRALDEWSRFYNRRKDGFFVQLLSYFKGKTLPRIRKSGNFSLQMALINRIAPAKLSAENPYQDGCGLGIIQK
jgi:hypothetical protein